MPMLFLIAPEDGQSVVYRTPATDELLAKLDKQRAALSEYATFDQSTDFALALSEKTPLAAFLAVAGDVPLDRVTVDEFLRTMGADGLDCFY